MRVVAAGFLCLGLIAGLSAQTQPSLYPRPSEYGREVISLDGIWDFSLVPNIINGNATPSEVIPMPVPASYNDITVDPLIRDHVGDVKYERIFTLPTSWENGNRSVWIRFGSVCYSAKVYVNSVLVAEHEIGHLPFAADITSTVKYGLYRNTVTVIVGNILKEDTIPQGTISETTVGNVTKLLQSYTFDFFNYAGIDRSVFLYTTTAALYIRDITISTELSSDNKSGTLHYVIDYVSETGAPVTAMVSLFNKEGRTVGLAGGDENWITITNPELWWPYLMSDTPGYLYTMKVVISSGEQRDSYSQQIGFRQITWNNSSVLINGQPIYLRGFGRHEDSNIRGKGLDLPLIVRDHNLIKWIGANAYRTSHYPYAEEIMDMADQLGIMIIDECPGVNIDIFSDELLSNHKKSLTELIQRDKNRPSVIMWSIANEPRTDNSLAGPYFQQVAAHVKDIDDSRPVTIASDRNFDNDHSAEFLDVLMVNRYYSWYSDAGRIEVITNSYVDNIQKWRDTFNKPIMVSEYGADTIPGQHNLPEYVWSEEYQTKMMEASFKAFDILRERGGFFGEMIWNFADFMTAQTITRVNGNRKGVFTRERQPKASAHLLRKRYWALAKLLNGVDSPEDVTEYVVSSSQNFKEEL